MATRLTTEYVRDYFYENGFVLLDENYINNNSELHIKDFDGYEYSYKFQYFSPDIEPAKFYYKNPYTEHNIKLWLILNNKPFTLIENQKFNRNNEVLYFKCLNCDIDEKPFKSCWNEIQQNKGCGICDGRQVGLKTSLEYLYPIMSKEWLDSEHGLTPKDVTKGSREFVYWMCNDCGHKWWNKVSDRIYKNVGCPACSGFIITDRNRVSTNFPIISSEWHPTNNGDLTPDNVSYGSNKKAWWICSKCDYEWPAFICDRTTRNQGCPKCAQELTESKIATECKQYFYDNYDATPEYKLFRNPKTNRWLKTDIYIPDNIYVEIHGGQHYKNNKHYFKTDEEFEYRQYLDQIKKQYCQENGLYIEVDLRKIKTADAAIIYIEQKLQEILEYTQ